MQREHFVSTLVGLVKFKQVGNEKKKNRVTQTVWQKETYMQRRGKCKGRRKDPLAM